MFGSSRIPPIKVDQENRGEPTSFIFDVGIVDDESALDSARVYEDNRPSIDRLDIEDRNMDSALFHDISKIANSEQGAEEEKMQFAPRKAERMQDILEIDEIEHSKRRTGSAQRNSANLSLQFMHAKEAITASNKGKTKMNLYAVQEIVQAHSDSIWVAKFSPCGNYLATGGKDAVLKIWKVKRRGSDISELVR